MRQYLRSWSRALGAATLVGALGAAGCKGTTTTTDLAPSDFPGSSVADAFLSDDGQAFTNNGFTVNNVLVFRNVSNDDAIVIITGNHISGSNSRALFASFFDGTRFTPPVSILGDGEDASATRSSINVLFLETSAYKGTSSSATSAGRGRDRDAIITYVGRDTDDVSSSAAVDRDANARVYATYFDHSAATRAASGTVEHGFDRVSHAIDFDGVVTGGGNDANALSVGFVSDSLHGTHRFAGNSGVLSGDPTSFVQIAFRKAPSTNTTMVSDRWFTVPFDLGQTGNAFVPQAGATSGLLSPAVGTLEDGDSTSSTLIVNDGAALWTADRVDVAAQDRVLTASIFDGTSLRSVNVGSDPTANYDSTDLPDETDVYGPDHGVDSLYIITTEDGFTNSMTGSRALDTDLVVAQIDAGATTRAVTEVDAFRATVDIADTDLDGYELRDGTNADVNEHESRINKDSSAIVISLLQTTDDRGDVNDATGGATVGAPATNQTRYLQVVQTGRAASDLANSVLATLPKVPALESTGDFVTGNDVTQQGVDNFNFQIGVPTGAAAAFGGPNDPSDAWQSNPNRMFFTYTQYGDVTAGGMVPNEIRLFTAGIEITPGATGAAPTAALVRSTVPQAAVTFPNTSQGSGSDSSWGGFSAQAVDRGIPVGDVVTFYNSNDNHVPDSTVMGAYTARRLYVWDGTTTTLVSSAGTSNFQTTGAGAQIQVVGTRIHVVFPELAGAPGSEMVIGARSFASAATLAAIPAFGSAPAFIDLPEAGALQGLRLAASTTTLGVFIQENGHVYYNETRSDAAHYRLAAGLPDPTLVDNDATHSSVAGFMLFLNDGANTLRDSFVLYGKQDPVVPGLTRGYVRVHD